jgi:hypothetical protein
MNWTLTTLSNWLSMAKKGYFPSIPDTGTAEFVSIQLSGVPQTTSKVLVAKTIPISSDYEFASVQVGIALTGSMQQEKSLDELARAYAVELLERELESQFNLGRPLQPLPDIPLYVSMGEMTLGYSKTAKEKPKQFGMPETVKIMVEKTRVFEPNYVQCMLVHGELVKALHEQYATVAASLGIGED